MIPLIVAVCIAAVLAEVLNVHTVILIKARSHNIGFHLLQVDRSDLRLVTIEDLGDLLESRALGLDIQEEDEEEFNEDPDL